MVKLNFKILWRTKVKFRIPRPQPFTYASIAILSFVAYAGHNSLKNPLPEKPPVVLGVENRKTIRSCLYNLSNRLKVHKNLDIESVCEDESFINTTRNLADYIEETRESLEREIRDMEKFETYTSYELELAKSKKERNPLSKPIGLLLTGLAIASVLYAGKKTAN